MNSTERSGLTRTEGPPVNRGAAVASATAISRKHCSTGIVIWNLTSRSTLEAVGCIAWLGIAFKVFVCRTEHIVSNRGIVRIFMGKRISAEPLDNNRGFFKHSVTHNPLYELPVDVQVLVGI